MSARVTNRTERLETIERLLFENPTGLRAVEIARTCGVDRRTIYRDMAVLTDAGLPVYQNNGRFRINREYYLSTLRLNLHEAMALFMALRVLTHHLDEYNPHVLAAIKKLGEILPDAPAQHVRLFAETLQDAPVDPNFITVLETMTRAWSEQRIVKLWYSSPKRETVAREFAPYFIEMTPTGEMYVIGHDSLSQRIRPFRLRRIMRVRLLRTAYQIPATFNPQPFLAKAWGGLSDEQAETTEVILRISDQIAPTIAQQFWHPSQRIETAQDGTRTLHIMIASWRSMLPWIRSWGAQVEVIKPDALRNALAEEAELLVQRYIT